MSGAEPPVGASSGSCASLPPPPPPQEQQQEIITAAQLPVAIREIIKQQEITATQLSEAIRELTRQQQQQEITAAARSESDELRGWLLMVATLTASITYSAALNPPGGFWQSDDSANGYIPGIPVLAYTSPSRYLAFHRFNIVSFASSLSIIALCSIPTSYNSIQRISVRVLVIFDIIALAGALIAGSSTTPNTLSFDLGMALAQLAAVVFAMFSAYVQQRYKGVSLQASNLSS